MVTGMRRRRAGRPPAGVGGVEGEARREGPVPLRRGVHLLQRGAERAVLQGGAEFQHLAAGDGADAGAAEALHAGGLVDHVRHQRAAAGEEFAAPLLGGAGGAGGALGLAEGAHGLDPPEEVRRRREPPAGAGEVEVGVGVDEPREERRLAEVLHAGPLAAEVGVPPHLEDPAVVDEHRPVVDGGRRVGHHGAGAPQEGTGGHGRMIVSGAGGRGPVSVERRRTVSIERCQTPFDVERCLTPFDGHRSMAGVDPPPL